MMSDVMMWLQTQLQRWFPRLFLLVLIFLMWKLGVFYGLSYTGCVNEGGYQGWCAIFSFYGTIIGVVVYALSWMASAGLMLVPYFIGVVVLVFLFFKQKGLIR